VHRHAHQLGQISTQPVYVLTLLADHDAGTRRVDRDARGLSRALDLDAADGRLRQALAQKSRTSRSFSRYLA
jgi:hypothetical protein